MNLFSTVIPTVSKQFAGKLRLCLFIVLSVLASLSSKAQPNHVVISQVYGGGGNTGAPYTNDFVELYNPTTASISLVGMSVQYASATGTSWTNKVDLTGFIAPGGYYLIQLAAGTTIVSASLPSPDRIGTINLSATAGKVALVNSTTALTGSGCPIGSPIIDFVGFGTTADCREGATNAPAPSNTTSIIRKTSGCTDTNNNGSDFVTGAPNPRNSGSPVNNCTTTCLAPTNQPTALVLSASFSSISGSFTAAAEGTTLADGYLVLRSTSSTLSQQPVSGTAYTAGATLGNATVVSVGNIISFNTSGLAIATPYYFFIYSYSTTGNCYNTNAPLTGTISTNAAPNASVAAGNNAAEPATNGTFTITLSAAAPAEGVTVAYTLGGSATLGSDYTVANNGVVTIHEGQTSATITLTVLDDAAYEATKAITITLSSATGGFVLGNSNATINLLDNDFPKVVINQVYGAGGNANSIYKNDFIELYNNENFPVNLNGWSVQYASATGTGTWAVTNLTGTIPAKGFYLIRQAAGTGGTTDLPAHDASGNIAMSGTAGKIALSSSTTALSGANPTGNVIDKVGYGTTANGFEAAPASGPGVNTEAVVRVVNGQDSDNNAVDFKLAPAEPRNTAFTTTPPVILTLSPADNSIEVPTNTPTTIVFNKEVQKGTGFIRIFENEVALTPIDVNSADVAVSGKTVTVNVSYAAGKSYSIQIDAGAFRDAYNNSFAGINSNTTWNFTTYDANATVSVPVSFDFQTCTSTSLLPRGFTQYSQTGSITWSCTTFGRDPAAPAGTAPYPNAVQISGFANNASQPNVDWLISPAFNLTGTNFPLLSFWSRTAFGGAPLQLKISTDYSGTGDPATATWTDLNGKFPAEASNVWTLSSDINLSAYKGERVYIAFVYTSTSESSARWTIDDFSIANASQAPAPTLTVSATDLQFNFVQSGTNGQRTFTFTGNDLTNGVTVNANSAFQVSKDGSSFSSSITYTVEEVNDKATTVYVRFAPATANENFSGTVTVTTGSLTRSVNLKGTSIDPATTLEVVNWNIEWFGHTGNGPTNEDLQEQNVLKILKAVDADVYALMEVVDEAKLARVVNQMPGYQYVISNFGSHTNTSANPVSALADAQKLAFVYKTAVVNNLGTRALLSKGINSAEDITSPYYNYWSSGRFPYMMNADVTLGGVTKNVKFILVHAKANTNPLIESYERRKAGADVLHDSLRILFPNDELVILGDFNDDLDVSITAGKTTTSWDKFTTDTDEYVALTLPLSLEGKKSTVSYNDIIDHVVVSNEMNRWYLSSTASILTDAASLVSNYGSTTSDHYPVFSRYMFCSLTKPADIVVASGKGACGAEVTYTYNLSPKCGTITASHLPGSFFPVGNTTVTLTASTGEKVTFTVTVTDENGDACFLDDDGDGFANADDCAPNDATKWRTATLYRDADGDGYHELTEAVCYGANIPSGYISSSLGLDNCTGKANPSQADLDGDNIGDDCDDDMDGDGVANADDCEPRNPLKWRTANLFIDADGDGYDKGSELVCYGAAIPAGYKTTTLGSDCDDTNAAVNPGAAEVCGNGIDDNCNGNADENCPVRPDITINDVNVLETNGHVMLTVKLSAKATQPVSVNYQTADGTARSKANKNNPADYLATSGTLHIPAGAQEGTIRVPIILDNINEPDETFYVKLSRPVNAGIVDGEGVVTIVNASSMVNTVRETSGGVMQNAAATKLSVKVLPNPSSTYFTLVASSNDSKAVTLRVMDEKGRTIETKAGVAANGTLRLGHNYHPGAYYAEVVQGAERVVVKLVKLP